MSSSPLRFLTALIVVIIALLGASSSTAQGFFVGDSTVTVTNTVINFGGLTAGNSVTFQGNITVAGGDGVLIDPVPANLTFLFEASSIIDSTMSGVFIAGDFNGSLMNLGTIRGDPGVWVINDLNGSFNNSGTINGGGGWGFGG